MTLISTRMATIKPSPTLAVAAKAAELKAQGRDIIDFGVGEPDFDTPEFIKEGARQALKEGRTKYTPVPGTLALRKAIASKFEKENELTYTPEQIMVSTGAKQVLFNAFLATLNPGDEVIIPAPYWVSYPDMVAIAGGTPVIVPCPLQDQLKLTPSALEQAITSKTKWLILNSPSNPTGMVYTKEELEGLAEVLRKHPQVYIMNDDIYEHLVFDGFKFTTLAQVATDLKEKILIINGLSKSYAMTGWRLGYGAGSQPLIKAMTILQSQSTSNASSISQEAARIALEGSQDFLKEWVKVFEDRRDQALKILEEIPGLECLRPLGAFYLYPFCPNLIGKVTPEGASLKNDTDLANYLLEAAGVAVVPGEAFGSSPSFRISYALSTPLLLEGCNRISKAIQKLR